jgi:hypothetical protein
MNESAMFQNGSVLYSNKETSFGGRSHDNPWLRGFSHEGNHDYA